MFAAAFAEGFALPVLDGEDPVHLLLEAAIEVVDLLRFVIGHFGLDALQAAEGIQLLDAVDGNPFADGDPPHVAKPQDGLEHF